MKYSPRVYKKGSYIVRDTYNSGKKNGWYEMVDRIRARDNNTCVFCGAPASEVHHLIPLSKGGVTTPSNLVCICKACHNKRHAHLFLKRGGYGK